MPEILRAFLALDEVAALRALADASGWIAGRQGTGYEKLPLPRHPLAPRALAQLGTPFEDCWDAYLVRYPDGAYVPDRVDAAQHGRRHRRLNALVAHPRAGGELRIAGAIIALELGDAVVFDPDREAHRVSPVSGIRLVFSVGAWV